jgi:hypothetical protein
VIAPFDNDIDGAKNFWLRELTPDGFKDVTELESSHSYIISMPNNLYSEEYNLNGEVTFSAENVELSWEPIVSKGATFSMYPTYETVSPARGIYVLNSDYWVNGYDYGSVFVHSSIDVNPFEAYIQLNDSGTTMRSVLPISDKRTAVRGAASSNDTSNRSVDGKRKPQKDDK